MLLERIRFMKVNKHKSFNFTPRYYDERKERIQDIREKYKENQEEYSMQQAILRDKIQTSWYNDKSHSRQSRMANVRLIIILLVLLLVSSYILGYLDTFTAEVIDLEKTGQ